MELNTILSFKKLGLPLKDIKEIKLSGYAKDIIILKLSERKTENQRLIDIASCNNEIIESILTGIKNDKTNKSDPKQEAYMLSRLVCLENERLENFFSEILWL